MKSTAKQKETRQDSEVLRGIQASKEKLNLDPEQVLFTLYDRVQKDCNDAQRYLSIGEIVGCLETIKLSIFQATHLAVVDKISKELSKGETIQ